MSTRVYQLGVILGDIAERRRDRAANQHLTTTVEGLYGDLQTRLEVTFNFTDQQSVRPLLLLV